MPDQSSSMVEIVSFLGPNFGLTLGHCLYLVRSETFSDKYDS
jgi:hypothetical protein